MSAGCTSSRCEHLIKRREPAQPQSVNVTQSANLACIRAGNAQVGKSAGSTLVFATFVVSWRREVSGSVGATLATADGASGTWDTSYTLRHIHTRRALLRTGIIITRLWHTHEHTGWVLAGRVGCGRERLAERTLGLGLGLGLGHGYTCTLRSQGPATCSV